MILSFILSLHNGATVLYSICAVHDDGMRIKYYVIRAYDMLSCEKSGMKSTHTHTPLDNAPDGRLHITRAIFSYASLSQ